MEMQFWKIYLEFFTDAIVSGDFKVTKSSCQTIGAAVERARLPKLSLILGNIIRKIAGSKCLSSDGESTATRRQKHVIS